MFALIDDQQITKFFSGNKGVTIGDVQYPKSIFSFILRNLNLFKGWKHFI